ncbi:hypothetical protein LTR95_010328 [Oleoguttula sp. CCFEE 5521]
MASSRRSTRRRDKSANLTAKPARKPEDPVTWTEVILDVGGILLAVLAAYPFYAMYQTHHTPHTHPFIRNITQYTDLAACTSHAYQGIAGVIWSGAGAWDWNTSNKAVSMIWSPNHDIQLLEDFGHCSLSFCKTADGTETAWVMEDLANKNMSDKCLDLAPYTPQGVIVECEREWKATFCEKYNGLKFRKQGCEAFGRYGKWYKKIRGASTY